MHLPDSETHIALEALYRAGRFSGSFGVGLSTSTPDDVCSAGSITEVIAASYERVSLASTSAGWAAAATRAIETIVDSVFPDPLEDWGTVLAIVIWSTTVKATGNPIGGLLLSSDGLTILDGGTALTVSAGAIRFTG
jgi:hypothetical protein